VAAVPERFRERTPDGPEALMLTLPNGSRQPARRPTTAALATAAGAFRAPLLVRRLLLIAGVLLSSLLVACGEPPTAPGRREPPTDRIGRLRRTLGDSTVVPPDTGRVNPDDTHVWW
jgi:hypothetical protein